MKRFLCLMVMFVSLMSAFAVPDKQPTMAILPFQIGNNIQIINAGDFRITAEIVENEFTNQLLEFFVRSRKFNVLNRTTMNRVMDENKLTESEWSKPGQEQYVGKLLVADYIVTGNINRLEFRVVPQDINITGERSLRLTATLKCQYKVTEVISGKVVAAGQVKEVLRSEDVRRKVPARERRDWTLSDYKDMLFDNATVIVGNAILSGIYPIKVASVSDKDLTLNRGEGAGLTVGQRLNVFNAGSDMVVDPDTKEVLGSQEKLIGVVEITEVTPKYSKGKLIYNTEPVQPGAICKLQPVSEVTAEPDYPRATPGW